MSEPLNYESAAANRKSDAAIARAIKTAGRLNSASRILAAGLVTYGIGVLANGSLDCKQAGGIFVFVGVVLYALEYVLSFFRGW